MTKVRIISKEPTSPFVDGLANFVVRVVCDLVLAWWGMIGLGIAHSFDQRVPDLGYPASFVVLVGVLTVPLLSAERRGSK